jgi:hypothetical protein
MVSKEYTETRERKTVQVNLIFQLILQPERLDDRGVQWTVNEGREVRSMHSLQYIAIAIMRKVPSLQS